MRKRGRKNKMPNKEIFMMMYENENVEIEELCKLYGVSKNTIYNWAYKIRKEKLSDKQIYFRKNCNKKKLIKQERIS